MCSHRSDTPLRVPGFPIRTSTDRRLVGSSPWLIAASHVLHRLQAPRHPPLALCSLENKDARARYGILKERLPQLLERAPNEALSGVSGPHRVGAERRTSPAMDIARRQNRKSGTSARSL